MPSEYVGWSLFLFDPERWYLGLFPSLLQGPPTAMLVMQIPRGLYPGKWTDISDLSNCFSPTSSSWIFIPLSTCLHHLLESWATRVLHTGPPLLEEMFTSAAEGDLNTVSSNTTPNMFFLGLWLVRRLAWQFPLPTVMYQRRGWGCLDFKHQVHFISIGDSQSTLPFNWAL